jgi:hypothetical protein
MYVAHTPRVISLVERVHPYLEEEEEEQEERQRNNIIENKENVELQRSSLITAKPVIFVSTFNSEIKNTLTINALCIVNLTCC